VRQLGAKQARLGVTATLDESLIAFTQSTQTLNGLE
jgi:hypothetical protein